MPLTFGVLAAVAASSSASNEVAPGVARVPRGRRHGRGAGLPAPLDEQAIPQDHPRPAGQPAAERNRQPGSTQVARCRRFAACPVLALVSVLDRGLIGSTSCGLSTGSGRTARSACGPRTRTCRPRRGPRRTDVQLPRPHPFACQAAELADMLAGRPGPQNAVGDAARKAVHDELTLQLPSAGGGPLASPELVRPEAPGLPGPGSPGAARHGSVNRVSLASWRVPVLAFGPAAALAVLGGSGQPDEIAVAGGSLTYLAAVARFVADLAARGRVLPVLAAEGESYAARWRPVLGGADAQRAHDLAAAMPPSCRAASGRSPRIAARQRPGCPGRRRRADPAAGLAAARQAGPHPGAPSSGRTLRAGPHHDRCPPRRGDAAGRGRGGRTGRGTGRVAGRRPDPGGSGTHLLPAGRARHPGFRRLAGRVRAAVGRRPQPDDLRRRCLGGPRSGVPRVFRR